MEAISFSSTCRERLITPGPAKRTPETLKTTWETAELCKYMENAFLALKVTFCNEFYELAQRFGVDYGELREA